MNTVEVSQSTQSKRAEDTPTLTMSLAEVAKALGVSYTSMHELVRRGESPVTPIRIGRQYRFSTHAVHVLLGMAVGE